MSVDFGHGLELITFKVYERTSSGSWRTTPLLRVNKKYRLRVRFKNVNSTSYMPPFSERHSHLGLYSIEILNARDAKFYSTSSYSGSGTSRVYTSGTHTIRPGKTLTLYFYFIWEARNTILVQHISPTIGVKLYSAVEKGYKGLSIVPLI